MLYCSIDPTHDSFRSTIILQRKTATENASRRASRADSPVKQTSTIPSIPPSPASVSQSQLPEIDEQGFTTTDTVNDTTITPSHPRPLPDQPAKPSLETEPTYPAPVPVRPPTDPGVVASRLSASLQSNSAAYQLRVSPSQPPINLTAQDMPDVGETRFQRVDDTPPPQPPMKTRATQVQQNSHAHTMSARVPDVPDPSTRYTPPDQQNGPVQGRPLIFAAMEATETSDAHDLRVDPRMIGFIGNVSAAVKMEEVHDFARNHVGYQTPNSTPPPPPPEKEEKPHRKKLSKVRRDQPSRKIEEVPVERNSPTRVGSSRTTVLRSPEGGDSRATRRPSASVANTLPTPVSPAAKPSTPPRTRDESQRQGGDSEHHVRKRSLSTENKQNRRSRDAVKMLTEKQMEKLSNRQSYNGSPSKLPDLPTSPSKRQTPSDQQSAYPPPPHKLSYRSTAPFIPTQPAEIPNNPQSNGKRSHHTGQLSISNAVGSRHISAQLPTPPEEYQPSPPPRPRREQRSVPPPTHHHHEQPATSREPSPEPRFYPLVTHLANPVLLEELLCYFTYYDWLMLATVSKEVRKTLYEEGREPVLERYLRTVGYARWSWNSPEPLKLRVEVSSACLVCLHKSS